MGLTGETDVKAVGNLRVERDNLTHHRRHIVGASSVKMKLLDVHLALCNLLVAKRTQQVDRFGVSLHH
jgi:hypothetical protein